MGLIYWVSLIEERTILPGLEEKFLSGLVRAFLSGLNRHQMRRGLRSSS